MKRRGVWAAGSTRRVVVAACLASGVGSSAHGQSPSARALAELSLEELANIEVTSASRSAEPLSKAPTSIFVITADDIRRSGMTTLAEALRLAPSLHVARIDAGQYAITARGFNGLAANKLLVLVDGRTIYTPLFSGVFWDQQDLFLEDIERIEVISGPGAALWGANAVNGVINVITRSARDTHGLALSIGGGTSQHSAALRYGAALGNRGHFRLFGKFGRLENSRRGDRAEVLDGRDSLQAGFRVDIEHSTGNVTLQGDAYDVTSADRGNVGAIELGRAELWGMNLLARWTHRRGRSDFRAQAYVDHAERQEIILFQPTATLYDVEIQHGISYGSHRFVWGAGYRHGRDEVEDGLLVGFRPTERDLQWLNAYAHDEMRLGDRVKLTAGLRVDRNDYTDWEFQPDVRLAWEPADQSLLWGGFSRAVRAPARFDRDVIRPLGGVLGGPDFVSEVANVAQVGFRSRAAEVVSWSLTGYLHEWDRLRSGTAPPVIIENKIEGPVYGIEGWASWQVLSAWRLSGGFTAFRKDLRLEPDSTDLVGVDNPQLSNDPGQQWIVRSSLNPWASVEVDAFVRHVGALPHPGVPAYTAVDARLAWRPRSDLELVVAGQNLFDRSHAEFNAAPGRSEFQRSVFFQARWKR